MTGDGGIGDGCCGDGRSGDEMISTGTGGGGVCDGMGGDEVCGGGAQEHDPYNRCGASGIGVSSGIWEVEGEK